MQAVEFTTELGEQPVVAIPPDAARRLPKAGHARVIILTDDDPNNPEGADWQNGAYQQFVRDDASEDSVYDTYR
jgi:hypothetical protein